MTSLPRSAARLIVYFALAIGSASHAAEIREEAIEYASTKFRVVRIQPENLQLVWKNDAGEPYRTFDAAQKAFTAKGKTVKFLMNAGIFEPGGIPSGIHVEACKEWLPLNERAGEGNFFLKPNGVVSYWKGGHGGPVISPLEGWKARVQLAKKSRDYRHTEFAAQSGPLLLISGQRHPAFRKGSENKLHRNGIGVDAEKRFVCAITESGEEVNFWDFAGLFLSLGCQNALFLDGDISQMAVNPDKPVESNQFGAMFVVAE